MSRRCVLRTEHVFVTDAARALTRVQVGGGVYSSVGTLKLVRPTFTDSTCDFIKPCGSGCICDGTDASVCVGCSCKIVPNDGDPSFVCDSN